MSILYTTFVAAFVISEGVSAVLGAHGAPDQDQALITREWTWSDKTSTTNFTAYGPAEQVNALDPQSSPLECKDCQLASSVQFGPEDKAALTEIAE